MDVPICWLPPQRPVPQLLVLLHDGDGSATDMLPLARALRRTFGQAAILAPDAPQPAADGHRWFEPWTVDAAADADQVQAALCASVQAALPGFADWLRAQQAALGGGPAATALAGFGQGATLALALAAAHDGLAGRVLAFGGRFAPLPTAAPQATTVHLLHGGADDEVDPAHARQALQHLGVLHGDATLDIAQDVGHELHPSLIDSALFRLQNHIPHRTWRAALGGSAPPDVSVD